MSIPMKFLPAIAGLSALLAPACLNAAEESGSFEFTTTFDNKLITLRLDEDIQRNPVGRVAQPPGQTKTGSYAFAGSVIGETTITVSTGGPFTVGEVAPFECVASGINVPGWVEVAAYCVTDHGLGDKWYRKSTRSADDYNTGTGQMELFGGTGAFANVEGNCTYEVVYSAPWSKGEILAKCDWQIPDEAA